MIAGLMGFAWLWPLLLAALWPVAPLRRLVGSLAAWAPLPALVLSIVSGTGAIELPWLLLGTRLVLDASGRILLALTSLLWLMSGLYARSYLRDDPRRQRYELFHLLTMAGNLGAMVAGDAISFVTCFALMSLSAYGLITHHRTADALRAGKVYIAMVVFGEVLVFGALVLAAGEAESLALESMAAGIAKSPHRDVAIGLALAGFGIKLGVMPLHVWLPLAHPAAPIPASAVLSGALLKTGLLALIRFLPWGAVALPGWSSLGIAIGISSALVAAAIGLTQTNPKILLGYSSVSQMGLVVVFLGAALGQPEQWPRYTTGLLLFAVHHGIAKGALFLATGLVPSTDGSRWRRTILLGAVAIPALALAGLPLTTGWAAKAALKDGLVTVSGLWSTIALALLPWSSVATTLLMVRLLWLLGNAPASRAPTRTMYSCFGVLACGPLLMVAILPAAGLGPASSFAGDFGKFWAATWPLLLGGVASLGVIGCRPLSRCLANVSIPAGDVLVLIEAAWRPLRHMGQNVLMIRTITMRDWLHNVGRLRLESAREVMERMSGWIEIESTAWLAFGGLFLALVWLLAG